MAENDKEKKIIVDEDWKSQAKKDKDALEAEEKAAQEKQQAQGGESSRPPLPEVDFAGLISMFATQAYLAMGLIAADPNEKPEPDLELGKFNIDMLALLEEKTRGNLDDEEKNLLSGALHQLRMAYVALSKQQGAE
ncbi:hypothetical protein STSP2_01511 [Anaerohalosphaera lusitana]|uniref:DUF1844 domain-containing protein n=1 Tax=Anaerohalosphaera lusitana TaxID=1936003 RepID=A0A1U9NKA5_9BACT|nr:DUF1844 domain-containing protein [Anaerohalosphaera lusitana]AQT68351.1 hypothetical protein STSP2_01511 [Anaerohalosphaera lusitana]